MDGFAQSTDNWLRTINCKSSIPVKLINKYKMGIDLVKYSRLRKLSSFLRFVKNPAGIRTEEVMMDNVRCEWIIPKELRSEKIIFAIHGGGYIMGDGAYSKLSGIQIAEKTGCKTLAVDYRLAPEHPFPAALEDVYCAYLELLKGEVSPQQIVLYGVSAGGGLCFSLCMMLKDNSKPLPCAIVALSPCGNFTDSGQTHITKADKDPIFTKGLLGIRDFYANRHDYTDPYLSPVFGDYNNFPPIRIYVGENEVLLSDSLMVGEKAYAQGVDIQVQLWKNLFHAFPIFGLFLPESRIAMREISDYILGKPEKTGSIRTL